MQKIKKINGEYKLVDLPTSYNGVENIEFGYRERTDLHVKDGFLTIVIPTTTAFHQVDYNLSNGILDLENGTFTYGVIDKIIHKQTIEELKYEYSQRISDIKGMREAIERNIIDGIQIPNDILEQREVLKNEYNTKVNEISKIDS